MLRLAATVDDMSGWNRGNRKWWYLPTSSNCTPVQLERLRRSLLDSWEELERERIDFERRKRAWLEDSPRPVDVNKPFCFVASRMKRRWREHDRAADRQGPPVDKTIGSTDARRSWFRLLSDVIVDDQVIRIRHRYFDEPAILLRESRFRDREARTPSTYANEPYQSPIIPLTAYEGRMSTGTTPSRRAIAAVISGDIVP